MSVLSLDYCLPFAFGLDHPEGVAWGLDGFVYAGGEAGQFYRVGLDGQVMQIATTDGFILGLALDADSAIYACVVGKPAVVRVAPNGTVTPYSLGTPQMLAPTRLIRPRQRRSSAAQQSRRGPTSACDRIATAVTTSQEWSSSADASLSGATARVSLCMTILGPRLWNGSIRAAASQPESSLKFSAI